MMKKKLQNHEFFILKKNILKKIAKIKRLDSPLWLHHKIESFSWKLLKQASFLL
jgi:hypothetical protein